jgi:hypothetical protein
MYPDMYRITAYKVRLWVADSIGSCMDGMMQFDLFVHVDSPLSACSLVFPFVIVLDSFPSFQNGTKKVVSMWPRSRAVIDIVRLEASSSTGSRRN